MPSALEIVGVTKTLGGICVLDDIRANVPSGKITAFIGPNGAGKTTLFHIMSGQLKADKGSILFDGRNIAGLPAHRIAELGVSRLFQDVRIFSGLTAAENIAIALFQRKERDIFHSFSSNKSLGLVRDKCRYWLDYVGLAECEGKLARELSFGQQKLLALARLFARKNKLLLLDEPTAGLSLGMVERVTQILRRSVDEQNITIALIEHHMGIVSDIVDWTHFLYEGKVAFSGLKQHVLNDPDVRKIYMGL